MRWDYQYQFVVFIDMVEFLPLLKKSLVGKTIPHNGYLYEFRDVEIDDAVFLFTVNAITPVKDGGFLLTKIYDDIGEIVDNIFSYIGKQFTISVQVFVNGEDVNSSLLPYNWIAEVFELANKEYNVFTLSLNKKKLVVTVNFSPLINFKNTVQYDDGVAFIVLIDVLSLVLDGQEVQPDLSTDINESIFVSFLSETLDSSQFENAMYYVLEPSFQFKDSDDFYYNAYYKTKSYKGKDVKDIGVFSDRSSFLAILEPL